MTAPGRLQPGAEARGIAAMLVRRSEVLMISDLGIKLNRSMTALSHAASRIEQRINNDEKFKERIEAAERFAGKYVSQA